MASLTIKNIPDELLDRLREVAERERRSITQQVLYMLEEGIARHTAAHRAGDRPDDEPSDTSEET